MHIAGHYGVQYNVLMRVVRRRALRASPALSAVWIRRRTQHVRAEDILKPSPNPNARDIAVLGGGITGLTAAYHLHRILPDATITIYDQQERLGGWLASEKVEVDGGEVLFEWGPRTLRPDIDGAGLATFLLLEELNLWNDLVLTSKQSPAAMNRFVYYPDHLVKMPGPSPGGGILMPIINTLQCVLTEPLFKGIISALLSEPAVRTRAANAPDESVGHFIKRRFGVEIADNLMSAIFHGIYAGDIYKLSAETLLPSLWYAETRDPEGNGILAEYADLFFKGYSLKLFRDDYFQAHTLAAKDVKLLPNHDTFHTWAEIFKTQVSVYTFAQGTAYLGTRLKAVLDQDKRITYQESTVVDGLKFDHATKRITINASKLDGNKAHDNTYDYVVSTLSPGLMKNEIVWSPKEQTLKAKFEEAVDQVNKAASVMVVNLYYTDPDLIPASLAGFGYLIPRSVPLEQNPERALGVIFGSETSGWRGSEAVQEVDGRKVFKGQDTAPGTKLTVMMGGHWWDGWEDSDYPDESEAIDMAKTLLVRHLQITQTPAVAKARLNRNCIPQYPVGYRQKMATCHETFLEKFKGRLKMAGPWWQGGVGVNDCTRKATLAAWSIHQQWDQTTGLQDYMHPEPFSLRIRESGRTINDPMQADTETTP